MEDSKKEKSYSPEEVARAILAKAHSMLKDSTLNKANTAHEIEAGEEPRNDDAEAPEYLANADIEDADGGEKKKKKEDKTEEPETEDEEPLEEEGEEYEEEYQKSEDLDKCGDMKEIKKMSPEEAAKKVMGDADLDEMLDKVPAHKRDDVLKKLRQMKKEGKSKEEMSKMCKAAYDMEGNKIDAKEAAKRNEISSDANKKGMQIRHPDYRTYNAKEIANYKKQSASAAKAAAARKAKKQKMAKSEGNIPTDGITKVYEFLAKSYGKKKA